MKKLLFLIFILILIIMIYIFNKDDKISVLLLTTRNDIDAINIINKSLKENNIYEKSIVYRKANYKNIEKSIIDNEKIFVNNKYRTIDNCLINSEIIVIDFRVKDNNVDAIKNLNNLLFLIRKITKEKILILSNFKNELLDEVIKSNNVDYIYNNDNLNLAIELKKYISNDIIK